MTIIERTRSAKMKPSPSSPSLTSLSPDTSLPSTPILSSSPLNGSTVSAAYFTTRNNGNGLRCHPESKANWDIKPSCFATSSINPIRQIVEGMKVEPNPTKSFIPLSIGDPTLFGNLLPCDTIVNSLISSIKSAKFNGYLASTGHESAREAVAKYVSVPGAVVDSKDVFLASGCSHALDLCIAVLGSHGKNILIPKPGFPLYKTLCHGYGIETRSYRLEPNRGWEVDIHDLESQIDRNTVAIIFNNPSNPCGSVFSKDHLTEILDVAERNHIPIIADEIYENMVFPGEKFIPIASLTTQVPVLSCRGTTKRFLIPGMRLGWITLHDRHDRLGQPIEVLLGYNEHVIVIVIETSYEFRNRPKLNHTIDILRISQNWQAKIRQGLSQLCQRLMGPNGMIQGALPSILEQCPSQFFDGTIGIIKDNAEYAFIALSRVAGLRPIKPSGAMYIMVGIDMKHFPSFSSDLNMMENLVSEESVFALPGQCFDYPNYMRLVLTLPNELTIHACDRIANFCNRHYVEFPCLVSKRSISPVTVLTTREETEDVTPMFQKLKT